MIELMGKNQDLIAVSAKYPMVAQALGELELAMKLCQGLEGDGK
jgi:hypothetical protein